MQPPYPPPPPQIPLPPDGGWIDKSAKATAKLDPVRADSWVDLIKDIGIAVLVWGAVGLLVYFAVFLHRSQEGLRELDSHLHEIAANVNKTTGVGNALMAKVYSSYGRTDKVADATLAGIEQLNATLARLDLELFGKQGDRPANPEPLVEGVRILISDLDKSTLTLTSQTAMAVAKLGGTADALTNSAKELDRVFETVRGELEKNSSLSQASLKNLEHAIATFDKQVEDVGKSLTANLKNTEGTTHNLDEITKSVDEALRPLRKTTGKLKAFLKFVSQFFRVTVPAF